MSANRYISFVELSSGVIRNSRIPLYSSKFSKRTYNQHQLLILLLLKEYMSEDYRDIVELTGIMDSLPGKDPSRSGTSFHDDSQVLSTDSIHNIHPVTQPAHEIVL
ncbi:MAG: hypothetical protein A4E35_01750 [Methanoregula sp. PtaU1.Bin051]|nr:MAG: hypothetical protein A4E35_02464 [Methanoregula sp. PtaU1.Bin051]OPY36911.1 MAG: hypothetical protein A4E35_01750 [Methanoregula sp. PtaU1.Bin051]